MITGVYLKKNAAYVTGLSTIEHVKVAGTYVQWDGPTATIKANGVYDFGDGILPANTAAPTIAGTSAVGATLTCTPGAWTGLPTPVVSHHWQADSIDIVGATALTYLVTIENAGQHITCVERASNIAGSITQASNSIRIPNTSFSSSFAVLQFN